jgi:outer membrane protein assembly factor BamB
MKEVSSTSENISQKSLNLLPGIIIVLMQWILRFLLPLIFPETEVFGIFAGLIGGIAIIVWWVFFSKVSGFDRWGAIVLIIISMYITSLLLHESIATGAQGFMFIIFSIPFVSLVFVAWAILSRSSSLKMRRFTMIISIMLACGGWLLVRTDGITGDFKLDLAWRWSKTAEEKLLAQNEDETLKYFIPKTVIKNTAEWPGFRGPERNSIVKNTVLQANWKDSPPKEIWRRPVGPGCSSFAISEELFFTQEQLGENELITCYHLNTGQPVWRHSNEARFWDSHAGAGPRSTPAFHDGRVYALGATGILNALNANDGSVIWSRDVVADSNLKHSGWGYTSSPLVVGNHVIVAVVGQLTAYHMESGELIWTGPDGGDSYSSPQVLNIDGIEQIVQLSAIGAISVYPNDGKVLWRYNWPGDSRIVQPALTQDGRLLICNSDGSSLRCVSIRHQNEEWKFEELWTSGYLKPNFNDFVIHKGYAYGFNGPLLVCIDLATGERMWRGGRYGGQIILLADQDLLIVLSERGKLALVKAYQEKFEELALLNAIQGKTWNHPAISNGILLVRNSQEMVGYQLN